MAARQYSLYGEAGDDTLTGSAGRDALYGGDGADKLNGGADNDTLAGGAGADNLNGGDGVDTADYSASSATVVVNPQSGSVSGGDASGDVLSNIENLTGSAFNDTLYGRNTQANVLDGGAGQDIVWGGTGNDTFVFKAGEANGDIVLDFAGNGSGVGDSFLFQGYGLASEGAHAARLDATHLQVTSADGTHIDIITIANGALVDQSDWMFG